MKNITRVAIFTLSFVFLFAFTHATYVHANPPTGGGAVMPPDGGGPIVPPDGGGAVVPSIANPLSIPDIPALLAAILNIIVQLAVPFLVLAVMYVGFLFVVARGNPEKLAQARTALWYTLLGALIILGAKTLATILSSTIGQLVDK